MNKRIEQLDSVRGLAALTVFFCHLPLLSMGVTGVFDNILKATGLINGHGAVMLFFVLSGFVLSLPFLKKDKIDYKPYLIKRYFRIYIPYLISIFFAMFLSYMFINNEVTGINEFSKKWWNTPLDLNLFLQHVFFLGNIYSDSFNGVVWSLIHELRISLVFPFIVLLVKRLYLKSIFLICLLLSSVSVINNIFNLQSSNGFLITYFDSVHYTSLFVLGSVLAKYREIVINFFKTKHSNIRIGLFITSIILYNFSSSVFYILQHSLGLGFLSPVSIILGEYGMAIAGVGFLTIAMSSKRVEKFLITKPISFLGKISFSLYLYHLPIILASVYLLNNKTSLWLIAAFAFAVSIIISYVAWYFIEQPAMKIGKRLANNITGKAHLYSRQNKVS